MSRRIRRHRIAAGLAAVPMGLSLVGLGGVVIAMGASMRSKGFGDIEDLYPLALLLLCAVLWLVPAVMLAAGAYRGASSGPHALADRVAHIGRVHSAILVATGATTFIAWMWSTGHLGL